MCDRCGLAAEGRYEILVLGRLGIRLARTFEGWEARSNPDGTTSLVGRADQAALHGTLARLRDLGITLIAVRRDDRTASAD